MAIISVGAAIFLTVIKIVVGLSTHSLGILSEAAHSGLDLVAAVMTVFAVRASAKPPDADHPYGHGKFENMSALFETALLLFTCVWIIREAVLRLFFQEVLVELTVWSFAVIVLSIVVDIGRSRALLKAAKRYQSAALEADALHFSTDIWSSGVVLFGLAMVYLAKTLHVPWLVKADSFAALVVAGIVAWVSIRLGTKTVNDLLDRVSPEFVEQARVAARRVPGVKGVARVRVRKTGAEWFSDITIQVTSDLSTEDSHRIADEVEAQLSSLMPSGDVVVHVEPVSPDIS